jgi:hypothetical protein
MNDKDETLEMEKMEYLGRIFKITVFLDFAHLPVL